MDKEYEEANKELLSERELEKIRLHNSYIAAFSTPQGMDVLEDLKKLHLFEHDTIYDFGESHPETAFKLGRRYVVASLLKFLETPPDEINKKQRKAIEENP